MYERQNETKRYLISKRDLYAIKMSLKCFFIILFSTIFTEVS